jgi:hypothetical protein
MGRPKGHIASTAATTYDGKVQHKEHVDVSTCGIVHLGFRDLRLPVVVREWDVPCCANRFVGAIRIASMRRYENAGMLLQALNVRCRIEFGRSWPRAMS